MQRMIWLIILFLTPPIWGVTGNLRLEMPVRKTYYYANSPLNSINLNKGDVNQALGLLTYRFSMLAPLSEIKAGGQNLKPSITTNPLGRDVSSALSGIPLVYPSPARMTLGADIGYYLDAYRNIEIRIYDMLGYLMISQQFTAGALGAQKGFNKVKVDFGTFGSYQLPAGVYFVLIMSDGKILGKTKFSVIP